MSISNNHIHRWELDLPAFLVELAPVKGKGKTIILEVLEFNKKYICGRPTRGDNEGVKCQFLTDGYKPMSFRIVTEKYSGMTGGYSRTIPKRKTLKERWKLLVDSFLEFLDYEEKVVAAQEEENVDKHPILLKIEEMINTGKGATIIQQGDDLDSLIRELHAAEPVETEA